MLLSYISLNGLEIQTYAHKENIDFKQLQTECNVLLFFSSPGHFLNFLGTEMYFKVALPSQYWGKKLDAGALTMT